MFGLIKKKIENMKIDPYLIAHIIPLIFGCLTILLFVYEKSSYRKKVEMCISTHIFRNNSEEPSSSAVQLHQVILNFAFIFCFGVVAMFVIVLIQQS